MTEARLKQILNGFQNVKIAVIGDFFLDKWLLINRDLDEPSLETGLTAYQVVGKRLCPGAAGTVTNNLSALSVGEIFAVGFIGDDGEGYELKRGLNETGVHTDYLLQYGSIFTPTYTKPLFSYPNGPEETHRLDIRNRGLVSPEIESRTIECLYEVFKNVDAVIALDQVTEQNTGVITDRVHDALAELGKTHKDKIIFADSRAHITKFRNIIIKCNHLEASRALLAGMQGEPDEETVKKAALAMAEKTGKPAFITWGARGTVAASCGDAILVPAVQVQGPIDICGAGDAATSGIVSALGSGAGCAEAALVGNLAASITIQQIGTTGTATREEIMNRFLEQRCNM